VAYIIQHIAYTLIHAERLETAAIMPNFKLTAIIVGHKRSSFMFSIAITITAAVDVSSIHTASSIRPKEVLLADR